MYSNIYLVIINKISQNFNHELWYKCYITQKYDIKNYYDEEYYKHLNWMRMDRITTSRRDRFYLICRYYPKYSEMSTYKTGLLSNIPKFRIDSKIENIYVKPHLIYICDDLYYVYFEILNLCKNMRMEPGKCHTEMKKI